MKTRSPRKRRMLLPLISAATTAMAVSSAHAVTFSVSWIGPANSIYSTAANWSGGVVPDNSGLNYYNVTIARPGGAVVGGNVPATILNLTVGSGSMLIPQQDKELTLIGTPAFGATTITNHGTLAVTSAIPYSRLSLMGSTTNLTGGGSMPILNGVVGGTSTLTTNNSIYGWGSFGNNTLAIINNGTFTGGHPDYASQTLVVNPGSGGFVNNGTLLANHGGILSLYDGTFNNSSGVIRANSGTVSISSSTVNGGSIIAPSGGTVSFLGSTVQGSALTTTGTGLARATVNTTTFHNISQAGNLALVNGAMGSFSGSINNTGTIHVVHASAAGNATLGFASNGTTTFSGGGTIVLNSSSVSSARISGTGTFVNAGNNIVGSGTFIGGTLRNLGYIRASGAGMTLHTGAGGYNSGSIAVLSNAMLSIPSGNWSNTGTVIVSGSATLSLGSNNGPSTFASTGSISISPGGVLETTAARTLDTTGGDFRLLLASTANVAGPFVADTVHLHGTLNQSGPMAAQSVAGFGTLNLGSTTGTAQHVRIGRLSSAGTLSINPDGTDAGVSRLSAPAEFVGDGRLDLNDNALVIDYTSTSPAPIVRAQLASGYAGGTWTGPGLSSSAAAGNAGFALGYAEAAGVFANFPATFEGQSVDSTTMLIKYTRIGDANLDGQVNLQDFNRLASNFGMSGDALWSQGDFNYDGVVNLQDFNRLASNFGLSASGPGVTADDWAALASAVPEPAGMIGVVPALVGLASVRRRRSRQS